jgi:hypothetical protein
MTPKGSVVAWSAAPSQAYAKPDSPCRPLQGGSGPSILLPQIRMLRPPRRTREARVARTVLLKLARTICIGRVGTVTGLFRGSCLERASSLDVIVDHHLREGLDIGVLRSGQRQLARLNFEQPRRAGLVGELLGVGDRRGLNLFRELG